MIDTVLQQLIDFIQNASPVVWDALIRQAYANAYVDLFWGALLGLFVPIVLIIIAIKFNDINEIYYFLSLVSFIAGCILATCGFKELYNPTYYAIMMILAQLPK